MSRSFWRNKIGASPSIRPLQFLVMLGVAGMGMFLLSVRTFAEAPTEVAPERQSRNMVSNPITYTLYLPLVQRTTDPSTPSIQPGTYPFSDKCMNISILQSGIPAASVRVCIPSIVIGSDKTMQFNMTWTAHVIDVGFCVGKGSDAGNRNMYATDNLGHRYDTLQVGGAAAYFAIICNQQTVSGWYLFPPAQPGANAFVFHDDDQHQSIGQLVLPLQ